MPHLAQECIRFLEATLSARNACVLLSQARLFEEPELMQRSWEVIDAQERWDSVYRTIILSVCFVGGQSRVNADIIVINRRIIDNHNGMPMLRRSGLSVQNLSLTLTSTL